jgi:hypothetical protein
MARFKEMFQLQTASGNPVTVGDVTLTPQSQALIVRWPSGGFVWNRPAAILVERGGQTERIPIVDVTRIVQLGLLGFSWVFSIVVFVKLAR